MKKNLRPESNLGCRFGYFCQGKLLGTEDMTQIKTGGPLWTCEWRSHQAEALKQERTPTVVSRGSVVREKVGLEEYPGVRQVLRDLTGHAKDDYL